MNTILSTIRLAICFALPVFFGVTAVGQESQPTEPPQRSQVVNLSQDGLVSGRIVAIDGPSNKFAPLSEIDVYFVQNGSVVRNVKTNADGEFVVDGLTPGAYSFIGASAKGFIAYGVVVKGFAGGNSAPIQIVGPTVSPRFVALKEIVERYLPKKASVLQTEPEIKTSLEGTIDVVDGANRIALKDGTLVGTVHSIIVGQDVIGTRVFLVQNDKVVSETQVKDLGSFEFTALEPGVYDFIAAGPAGFTAVSFQAVVQEVPGDIEVTVVAQENVPVDAQGVPAPQLDAALTPSIDGTVIAEQVDHANELCGEGALADQFDAAGNPLEMCGEEIGCGAAAGSCGCESDYMGGCGGGGAGVGGFSGWGGLASLLIAGWVLTELDDNNDDDNPNPPGPISPST